MNTVDYLLKHPFNTLSDVEQLIVTNLGPDQPDIAITQIHKTQTRHFNARWYERKPWLTASESRKTFFCFSCLLFGGDLSWTCKGVKDLKHLSERVKYHENTSRHKRNILKLNSWNKQKGIISVQLRKEESSSMSGSAENDGDTAESVTIDILPTVYETMEDPLMIPSTQTKITPTELDNVSLAFSSINDSTSTQRKKDKETGVVVEPFGDDLSTGESPAVELRGKQQNKDDVEEIIFHLRAEKLLLELDKLKLERQKMEAERRNIQLRADILSLRKQLITESVQTESPTNTAASLEAQEIGIMAAPSHHISPQMPHSQNEKNVQNSVLSEDLGTTSQTNVSSSHCLKALVSDSKCPAQSSEQTVLSQSGTRIDTHPVTSDSTIHHCCKLLSEALQRSASAKTTHVNMSTGNLFCYKTTGLRENNVTGLHESVESSPGHVNNELMPNVKSKRDQNIGKSHGDSGVTAVQHDADLPRIQGRTGNDFPTDKLRTKCSDNSSVKSTEMSVSELGLGKDRGTSSSSYRHENMDVSLHRLKDSVVSALSASGTSHKLVESAETVDSLSSLSVLRSGQHKRKKSGIKCSQKHKSTAEETSRDQHSNFTSRMNFSDSQKSEFNVGGTNTVQREWESYSGSQDMTCDSFLASKHGKRDESGSNNKDGPAVLCKRIKTDDLRS